MTYKRVVATWDRKASFLWFIKAISSVPIVKGSCFCKAVQSFRLSYLWIWCCASLCIDVRINLGPTVQSRSAGEPKLWPLFGLANHGGVEIVGLDNRWLNQSTLPIALHFVAILQPASYETSQIALTKVTIRDWQNQGPEGCWVDPELLHILCQWKFQFCYKIQGGNTNWEWDPPIFLKKMKNAAL